MVSVLESWGWVGLEARLLRLGEANLSLGAGSEYLFLQVSRFSSSVRWPEPNSREEEILDLGKPLLQHRDVRDEGKDIEENREDIKRVELNDIEENTEELRQLHRKRKKIRRGADNDVCREDSTEKINNKDQMLTTNYRCSQAISYFYNP